MRNLVAVLLASFQILLVGAERRCCFPPRFQAQKYYAERNVTVDFAVDFEASRIYEAHDEAGEAFHIIDLAGGTINLFENGQCRALLVDGSAIQRCLDEDTRIGRASVWTSTDVDIHRLETQNVVRTMFVTRRVHEVCIPVYVNALIRHNRAQRHIFYIGATQPVTGNNSDRLYSDLTNCQFLWG